MRRVNYDLASRSAADRLLDFIVSELVLGVIHRESFHFLAIGPIHKYGGNRVDVQFLESTA